MFPFFKEFTPNVFSIVCYPILYSLYIFLRSFNDFFLLNQAFFLLSLIIPKFSPLSVNLWSALSDRNNNLYSALEVNIL